MASITVVLDTDMNNIEQAQTDFNAVLISSVAAEFLTVLFFEYFRIRTSAQHKAALTDLSRSLKAGNLYGDAIEGIYQELTL